MIKKIKNKLSEFYNKYLTKKSIIFIYCPNCKGYYLKLSNYQKLYKPKRKPILEDYDYSITEIYDATCQKCGTVIHMTEKANIKNKL